MNLREDIKSALQTKMYEQLAQKKTSILAAKSSIQESKLNETKSSAGDKFETGRAMMQMELDKLDAQLDQLRATKNYLKQLDPNKKYTQVAEGALVITDKGRFYISVSMGKIIVDSETYFSLSSDAPLSKMLWAKKNGDQIELRDRKYDITKIV